MNLITFTISLVTLIAADISRAGDKLYLPSSVPSGNGSLFILEPGVCNGFMLSETQSAGIEPPLESAYRSAVRSELAVLPKHSGLTDSFVLETSTKELRLIRIDYSAYDQSPAEGRIWIASLRPIVEGAAVLQVFEYASTPVPVEVIEALKIVRGTESVLKERQRQMALSLKDAEASIQRLKESEEFIREMAKSTRQYGLCCPDSPPGSIATEARAGTLERSADECRTKIKEAAEELERLRGVILPQLPELDSTKRENKS
jgi:hypothetical protein